MGGDVRGEVNGSGSKCDHCFLCIFEQGKSDGEREPPGEVICNFLIRVEPRASLEARQDVVVHRWRAFLKRM